MGYKSKNNRDNWNGPWGWEADGMGHTKRRNEQRRNERRRQRRKEKQELIKNWKQEQES